MRWCSCSGVISLSAPASFSYSDTQSVVSNLQFQKPVFKFKTLSSLSLSHRKLLAVPAAQAQPSSSTGDFDFDFDFVVVNFYHFVFIKDPQAEVAKHLSFLHLQGLDIHGRVYLNEQGINAQYSGPSKDALAYLNWLREDNRFSDILVQISPSENGHAFPKLKLRYKPSLVQASHISMRQEFLA